MLTKQQKDRIIEKFKTHKHDTGSSEVQIAILTAEIKELTKHLKAHKKDYSSRRGLLRKVSQRRRLLRYLMKENEKSFDKVVKILKLKAPKVDSVPEVIDEQIEATETEETEKAVAEKKD